MALREMMMQYDDIHTNFRPGGKWSQSMSEPDTLDDWARVESYLGLLEFCNRLMREDLVSESDFKDGYSYRIINLLSNPRIVGFKLRDNARAWQELLALCKKMGIQIPTVTGNLPPFIRTSPEELAQ